MLSISSSQIQFMVRSRQRRVGKIGKFPRDFKPISDKSSLSKRLNLLIAGSRRDTDKGIQSILQFLRFKLFMNSKLELFLRVCLMRLSIFFMFYYYFQQIIYQINITKYFLYEKFKIEPVAKIDSQRQTKQYYQMYYSLLSFFSFSSLLHSFHCLLDFAVCIDLLVFLLQSPQNLNQQMYQTYSGLLQCNFSASNSGELSYCYLKAIQMGISGVFLVVVGFQFYQQILAYGWKTEWRFFALLFMAASLVVNMFFCLWNSVFVLYSLESYFYSMYFLTIVGYVFRLHMRKNSLDVVPKNNQIFTIVVILMVILYTAILVDSIVAENSQMINKSCEEVWYLCINVLCLTLCFIALILVIYNQREEKKKIQDMNYEVKKVKNPFFQLWFWVGMNTIAQIVNLIETGLLIGTSYADSCRLIQNSEAWNNILRFFFSVFTLIVGYIATIFYFRHIRLTSITARNNQNPVVIETPNFYGRTPSQGLQLNNSLLFQN